MLCVAILNKAFAQLCQGSLGDPIINTTFGAGTNPGASLVAATTNYQYSGTDCPNDGFYTVRNNSVDCFSSSWHTLNADHTGNAGGYFMLVNASVQPSAFYLETVRGLCGNTNYEFAAWVLNILRSGACGGNGIQPNLTFTIEKIDGTVLQTYNSGNIAAQASPVWQQFGFFFTTPSNVSDVVLRIVNNSSGGCGNDLALDDITFRPCGPKLTPVISGNATTTVPVCEGINNSYTFNCNVSAGFSNPLFQWQQSVNGSPWTDIPSQTTTSLTHNVLATTTPGTYSFRLAAAEAGNMVSSQCRVLSEPLTIVVNANPTTTASSNSPLCEAGTLELRATGGVQYNWTGVNSFSAGGDKISVSNVQPVQSGRYYVDVVDAAGCRSLDSVEIQINNRPSVTSNIDDVLICVGETVQLSAGGGDSYKWMPALGLSQADIPDPIASPADTTLYKVVAFNQFSCSDTTEVMVNVAEKPTANAGPDKYILDVRFVQLTGQASGQDINYSWTPAVFIDNPGQLQPIVDPPADTTYVLTVESNVGCGFATDSVYVYVLKDIFVPTAFSPNGDGLNDTWTVPGLNAFTEYEISIFNRGGQVVYYTKDVPKPWNGMYGGIPVPAGVYVYMIDLKKKRGILKGTLMVVR
jgi:gliding motility-associated-like protein